MPVFEREYKRLNTRQREAVDHIDGPLLVIAGPGTGKTQLLSLRVANILNKTDASAENILCLTFTNYAANNMRERLSALIGPEGNRVPVRTFHSFASELMANYPEYFWNGARLTHVPDAVQLEIITDILSELPLSSPLALKFAGQFTGVKDVREGLRLAKEAGLTSGKLRLLLETNLQYIDMIEPEMVEICSQRLSAKTAEKMSVAVANLPDQKTDESTRPLISLATVIKESFDAARERDEGTGKTTNLSAWKRRWISTVDGQKGMFEERKRCKWWLELADVYAKYREKLHAQGYYDYSDMIIEVITQAENRPDMLADAQEQYQYVLIDEFQDTNAAQLRLAHLIADHYTAEGKPNIMAVGDDDQAIYKFNGAELSNMLDFKRSYPSGQVVVLTDNYRSSQAILDFSDKLINQATRRLTTEQAEVSKLLTARNEPTEKGSVEHLSYPTKQHEYYDLANRIAKAHKSGGSVAVLARGHDSLRALAKVLKDNDVPIRYEQQESVLDKEVIQQIVSIAEIAVALNEGDTDTANRNIARLLAAPAWKIEPKQLWQLAIANRREHDWIGSLLASKDQKLQTTGHWLLWLARESTVQPLPRMLEYIMGLKASEHMTSPIREHFLESKGKEIDTPLVAALSGVHQLTNLASEFSKHGASSLRDFVRLIQLAQENNQAIIDQSLFVSSPDAVELLTVHKAKGLEFDSVFIADAQESIWRPNNRGRKPPANLPLKPSGDDLDDYIRLMFVAVTRAKRSVHIASYSHNDSGEEVLSSGIIRDILPPENIKADEVGPAEEVLERTLIWPSLTGSQEKLLLKPVLQDFKLSATALSDFLDVTKGGPDYFLQRQLLKLPDAVNVKAAFGSACHAALERAQQLVRDGSLSLGKVLSAYETALKEQYLPPTDYQRYLAHGQEVLTKLFNDYKLSLKSDGQPEVKLSDVPLGPARLVGNLDRVDRNDNQLTITDYKTGSALKSLHTRNKTLVHKAWRHSLQMQFYVLLARESRRFKTVKQFDTRITYVEAESLKDLDLNYTPTEEELQRLSKLIQAVWDKVASLNLPDTRHYEQNYEGIKKFEDDLLTGNM